MGGGARVARSPGWWLWFSLLPFGLGSWVPFVAGVRCGNRRWTAVGVVWLVVGLAGWVLAAVAPSGGEGLVGGLIVSAWAGGIVTSFAVTVGSASFSISGDEAKTVEVKLDGTGRDLLSAGHGRLSAHLAIVGLEVAPTQAQSKSVQLVQQKTHDTRGGKKK